jgi:hypothetical protein
MTTQTTDGDDGGVPVACALTAADLAVQSQRWKRLAARAMTGRADTADGLRVRFRPEPGAEDELRRLVAVETRCCPWADWAVQTAAGQLVLDVRSTGAGIAALHAMFPGRPGPALTPIQSRDAAP